MVRKVRCIAVLDPVGHEVQCGNADGPRTAWTGELMVTDDFLNMADDAYVHGSYETALELLNPATHQFPIRGHAVNCGER